MAKPSIFWRGWPHVLGDEAIGGAERFHDVTDSNGLPVISTKSHHSWIFIRNVQPHLKPVITNKWS